MWKEERRIGDGRMGGTSPKGDGMVLSPFLGDGVVEFLANGPVTDSRMKTDVWREE